MPRVSDHFVKSAIRLERQSTTVPNTSNTRAFTSGIALIVSFLFFRRHPSSSLRGALATKQSSSFAPQDWIASLSLAMTAGLQHLPVLDESEIIRDLVVQRAGLCIARLRQPVDPAGTRRLGLAINFFDQCASHAAAADIFRHVQIFKIAVTVACPCGAMKQIMREPQQPAVDITAERKQRLVGIVKPRP